jgi:hypothetical protein
VRAGSEAGVAAGAEHKAVSMGVAAGAKHEAIIHGRARRGARSYIHRHLRVSLLKIGGQQT